MTVEVSCEVERYPAVPSPITVLVRFIYVIPPLPTIAEPLSCRKPFVTVSSCSVPVTVSAKLIEEI